MMAGGCHSWEYGDANALKKRNLNTEEDECIFPILTKAWPCLLDVMVSPQPKPEPSNFVNVYTPRYYLQFHGGEQFGPSICPSYPTAIYFLWLQQEHSVF